MNLTEEVRKQLAALKGLECWYVSTGGAAGSTFELVLGEKIPRSVPLKNAAHSDEFRRFEGQASVFVWCAWRLDGSERPLTSCDDTDEGIERGLMKLIGTRIAAVELVPPAWDLNVKFADELCLKVFCDHVPGDPSFDGNWELSTQDLIVAFGPGEKYCIETKAR